MLFYFCVVYTIFLYEYYKLSIKPVIHCFDGCYDLSLLYKIDNQSNLYTVLLTIRTITCLPKHQFPEAKPRKIAAVKGNKKFALVRIVRKYVFYYTQGRLVVCLVRNIVCPYQTRIFECYDCLKPLMLSKNSLHVSRCSAMTSY